MITELRLPVSDHRAGHGTAGPRASALGPAAVPARGSESQLLDGPELTVAVEVMPPEHAASFLVGKGRAWEADLYRLAAERRGQLLSRLDIQRYQPGRLQ